ncbi:MAG: hypothetical protein IJI14_01520, partial [Anaerolineaceae bacterium]|nr:hypothetical protein [Anaerolineaceae bacterium]
MVVCLYTTDMSKNENLHKAKIEKNDEFYTRYEDIQIELNHYTKHFEGKTVLCNCDDPFESNFCKFFLRNFNYLKLKRLICTSYSGSPVAGTQLSLFDYAEGKETEGHGFVMDVTNIPMKNRRGVSDEDIDNLLHSSQHGVKILKGNGSFDSPECIEYLKIPELIVCTNPPFSRWRDYMSLLFKYDVKFLVLGNTNAITYKEIFPYIKDNRLWVGYKSMGTDMLFHVTKDFAKYLQQNKKEGSGYKIVDGNVMGRAQAIWYTNLDIQKRHEKLILYEHYYDNEEMFPKYDNYDAINVDKVAQIPVDYVPCWFKCPVADCCEYAQQLGMNPDA